MVRTRFALIMYFRMVAHKAACHTLSKSFLKINEDMVQILLMLEVLFTHESAFHSIENVFFNVKLSCLLNNRACDNTKSNFDTKVDIVKVFYFSLSKLLFVLLQEATLSQKHT